MADPPMTDDDLPATRRDLRELRQELRAEFRQELRDELTRFPTRDEMRHEIAQGMNYVVERVEQMFARQDVRLMGAIQGVRDELRGEIAQARNDLSRDIARAARAGAEEHRRELGVIDEKYRDLPGRVAVLERDLDAHRGDSGLHSRPKRPRR